MFSDQTVCRLVRSFPQKGRMTFGLEPVFYYISKEQVKLGAEVHVIAAMDKQTPLQESPDGILVHRVKQPYNFYAIKKLKELDKLRKIDVVHSHATSSFLYSLTRSLTTVKKPLFNHIHTTTLGGMAQQIASPMKYSFSAAVKTNFWNTISLLRQKAMWKRADILIAVSNAIKDELINYYGIPDQKIRVVHNGVDIDLFKKTQEGLKLKEQLGLSDKHVVLFVGHFGLRKGLPYLLRAISKISELFPNVFLMAVGGTPKWLRTDVYWNILRETITNLRITPFVGLVDKIPNQELPKYYSMADVFVLPTLYDPCPKVILEAMACETPIIASKVSGIPELIEDGHEGILIPSKNSSLLADKIIDLLSDQDNAKLMGKNARTRVEKEFTWRLCAQKILQLYINERGG
ncbi:MAG: glycosyltransferase family 4 protein [Promethearchaeota archaeon]